MNKTRVALLHPRLGWGGSEAAAYWGIQALVPDFEVTLISSESVDAAEVDAYYGTNLQRIPWTFRQAGSVPFQFEGTVSNLIRRLYFRTACRRLAKNFDVIVSAYNPIDCGAPALHYIQDFSWDADRYFKFDPWPNDVAGFLQRFPPIRHFCLFLFRQFIALPFTFFSDNKAIFISSWAAKEAGQENATILYPPVHDDLNDVPFGERTPSFVAVGRISSEKRVEEIISILSRVRAKGHDVRLHLIGPFGDDAYGRKIRRLCDGHRAWIVREGRCDLERKKEILSRHRFGLHARRGEAFGIAVAEMVKAGVLPFVYASGGPAEIVGHPDLCYKDQDDAVEKIDRVLREDALQKQLSVHLKERGRFFSTEKFIREFRSLVGSMVKK